MKNSFHKFYILILSLITATSLFLSLNFAVAKEVSLERQGEPEHFSMLKWFDHRLNSGFAVKLGVGPYYKTDLNAPSDGPLWNEQNLGVISAIALAYYIPGSDLQLRLQYDNVDAPGIPYDKMVSLRVATHFGQKIQQTKDDVDLLVSLWAGPSKSEESGASFVPGYQMEVMKKYKENISYSVTALYEGESGSVDRGGMAGQVWYIKPLSKKWSVAAGVGPYVARDKMEKQDEHETSVSLLTGFQLSKSIAPNTKVGLRWVRVTTGRGRDQNLYLLGIQQGLH